METVEITLNGHTAQVSPEIKAFLTIMEHQRKKYDSHTDLLRDFMKFQRFLKHFDNFEKEEDSDLYPEFQLYHTVKKNQPHSHHQ